METTSESPLKDTTTLTRQCFYECEAMAKYALASGHKVSGQLLQQLKELEKNLKRGITNDTSE